MMKTLSLIFGVLMVISATLGEADAHATSPWVLSASQAKPMLNQALVWDTRGAGSFAWSHLINSTRVKWTDFSQSGSARGNLLPKSKLQKKLRALGVKKNQRVIVVGDPQGGWGEEGRLVWMLRAVGHPSAAMVDGGFEALKKAGAEVEKGTSTTPLAGDIVVQLPLKYTATQSAVKQAMGGNTVIFDAREQREYDGRTPYGESRGGHIPGAKHLYYRDLLTKSGLLKSDKVIRKILAERGVTKSGEVVTYCTGGVRSAWLVVVMQHLGFVGAKNYAGSMWEWSAGADHDFPLE